MAALHTIAPNLAVAAQLGKADLADLARQGYGTIINNRPDGEEPGQPSAAEMRAEAERHGLAYVHIPVTTPTITAADVAAHAKAVAGSAKPVVAHCRSGTRSYIMWAASQALAGKAAPADLVAEGAAKGFDLSAVPALVEKLRPR
jgi:uncharacterized protein (TIGR01244 family)